jgi:DNA repair protein RadC
MQTAVRNTTDSRLFSTLVPQRDSTVIQDSQVQGLAGADLAEHWDACQFAMHGRSYSREFLTRMHHPFGEVLAALFLDGNGDALCYNTYFRGERPSALSHLPGITQTGREMGAARVLLAYNMIFDPEATLPDVRRMHARMHEAGLDLHDFLLIGPNQSRSLLAPSAA